ncbi:hypothetical protein Btru_051488 [Bulinus truncatus]|nr:hypothetical protein Btru_051488 [Bulinus truncatus]
MPIIFFKQLTKRELEYVALSRDTTESDLKQRREIESGTASYIDQCAVRAALEGRILVLEGIEKAERNVLPVLNNLLENREMQLDDGRFLMAADRYDKLLADHSQEELDALRLVRVRTFCKELVSQAPAIAQEREGEFGACFFLEPNTLVPVIYCARPGSRMWEVDFNGKVLHTHQFKQLLATPSIPVIQLFQFIATWSLKGIYIFDPVNVKVVVWTQSIKGVKDISVVNNDLYIFLESSCVQKLTLLPIYQLFTILSTRKKWLLMSNLLLSADQINIRPAIMKRVKQDLLQNLIAGLKEEGKMERVEKVIASLEDLSEGSIDSLNFFDDLMDPAEVMGHTYLPSGIVVVSEGLHIKDVSSKHFLEKSRDLKMNSDAKVEPTSADNDNLYINYESLDSSKEIGYLDNKYTSNQHTEEKMFLYVKNETEYQTESADEISGTLNEHHWRSLSVNSFDSETDDSITNSLKMSRQGSNDNVKSMGEQINLCSQAVSLTTGKEPNPDYHLPTGVNGNPVNGETVNDDNHTEENDVKKDVCEISCELVKSEMNNDQVPSDQNLSFCISTPPLEPFCLTSSVEIDGPTTSVLKASSPHNGKDNEKIDDEIKCLETYQNPLAKSESSVTKVSTDGLGRDKEPEYVLSKKSDTGLSHLVHSQNTMRESKQGSSISDISTISKEYLRIDLSTSADNLIALPVKRGRKKKRKTLSESKSRSASLGFRRETFSLGDEPELFCPKDRDFDSISIGTISSFDEDDNVILPDEQSENAFKHLLASKENPFRKISASVPFASDKSESIPPLKDRLAVARGSSFGDESPPSLSPLSGSGEHNSPIVGSPKPSLSTLSDSLSHIKNQTKSFIKTIKEKNILTKSNSSPFLTALNTHESSQSSSHTHKPSPGLSDDSAQLVLSSQVSSKQGRKLEEEVAAFLDLTSLYKTAREVKKTLSEPASLLKPKSVLRILNEWAKELNGVMLEYHKLLFAKRLKEKAAHKTDICPANELSETLDEPDSESDKVTSSTALQMDDVFLTHVIEGENRSIESKDKSSDSFTCGTVDSLHASYWTKIIHSKDPFHLSADEFELIQYLTTLCFISCATGNLLGFLGLSEKSVMYDTVRNILPAHLHFALDTNYSGIVFHRLIFDSGAQESSQDQLNYRQSDARLKDGMSVNGQHCEKISSCEAQQTSISCDIEDCDSSQTEEKIIEDVKNDSFCLNSVLQQDISLALFTRLYFFALDFEKIKQELNQQEGKLFLTWVSVLHCSLDVGQGDIVSSILSDKQINSAMDYLRSGILPRQSAFLGHIYKLFELTPNKTSEFCGEVNKRVSLIDLLNLCVLSNKPATIYIMKYIKQWMFNMTQIHRQKTFNQLCKNKDLRYLLLKSLIPTLLQDLPVADSARIYAVQVVAVLPFDWLNTLLVSIETDDEIEDIVDLSIRMGYWPITIKLLNKSNQWKRLLKIIIDNGDIRLLKGNHGEGAYIPQDLEQWKYLLKIFEEKQKNEVSSNKLSSPTLHVSSESLNKPENIPDVESGALASKDISGSEVAKKEETCYESFSRQDSCQVDAITWCSLGYTLLNSVGGALTIDLLLKHLHDPLVAQDCLNTEFLCACYMDYKIKLEQDHMTHEMLEKLSAYMWTKKPGFVPPSVFHAMKKEKTVSENGEEETVSLQGLFNQIQSLDSDKLMSEHLGGHWGQEVNITSSCLVCNIPLKSVMSLSIQGVIVFPCGHAFHKCCVQSTVCPILH